MANSKYADMGKDALVSEIKTRRAAGRKIAVDLRANEDDLRAALNTDDVENGDFSSQPSAAIAPVAPARNASELGNQLSLQGDAPSEPTQPKEEEWSGADLYRHKGDGFTYQVVKKDAGVHGKPVKARIPAQASGHSGLYWEGSEAEFAEHFEKL